MITQSLRYGLSSKMLFRRASSCKGSLKKVLQQTIVNNFIQLIPVVRSEEFVYGEMA